MDGPNQPPTDRPKNWPKDWKEEDPGLPIEFGPASNAEYDPEPVLPPVLRETIRRARDDAERTARRLGMSRREFLLSACGAATTLAPRGQEIFPMATSRDVTLLEVFQAVREVAADE